MTKTEIASILRYEAISNFKAEIKQGDYEKRIAALISAAELVEGNA